MVRTVAAKFYSVDFETVSVAIIFTNPFGTHVMEKMLNCLKDIRGEAMEYDKNAIGVYRTPSESEQEMLVGHVPIEISSLMNNFLKASYSNKLVAKFLEREYEKLVWLLQRNSKL